MRKSNWIISPGIVVKIKQCLKPPMCAVVKSRYIGDGHPTFNRSPYDGYINPYYWVDDHRLLYGNNGSLDPSTNIVSVRDLGNH